MTQDTPFQLVEFLNDELLWPDQPLGRDPAGTKQPDSGTETSLCGRFGDR